MHSDADPAVVSNGHDVAVSLDSPDLGPLSPELALVDPGLARAARALLPEPAPAAPQSPPVAPAVARPAAAPLLPLLVRDTAAPTADERRPRRARRIWLTVAAALVGALGLVLLVDLDVLDRSASPASVDRDPSPTVESPPTGSPPTVAPKPTPPTTVTTAPTPPPAGQTFVWAPAAGAAAYEFQLFREGNRVFRTRVTQPRLVLPRRWRQGGRTQALEPGSYRWYVWPISAETQRQSRVATVQARLVIDG